MTNHPTAESFMEKAKTMVPYIQRSGTPEDFVGLMLFLTSRAGACEWAHDQGEAMRHDADISLVAYRPQWLADCH